MRNLVLLPALAVSSLVATQDVSAQVRVQTVPGGYAYAFGEPDRPMIGVSTRSSGKRDTLGLLVESVTRDSPAEKAGIEEGDRLVSVNSVNLRLSAADAGESDMDGVANRRLIRELEKQKAGDEVELRVYRDGNTRTIRVKTVTADELNKETLGFATSTNEGWRRLSRDRAVLGISLGGNGSRRDTLGILVVGVSNAGPAAKAGIDEGDRVVAINGVDLRVAAEDAGDGQASSARINRLNREMEKVKAGDAVELRVYSAGQVKTVRVEAAKASDVGGEAFFFNGNAQGGIRSFALPRAIRVRPPSEEFEPLPAKAAIKADMERAMKSVREAVKRSADVQMKMKSQIDAEVLKKLSTARKLSIA
jgi:predicted metalloprotease with PDZ domain